MTSASIPTFDRLKTLLLETFPYLEIALRSGLNPTHVGDPRLLADFLRSIGVSDENYLDQLVNDTDRPIELRWRNADIYDAKPGSNLTPLNAERLLMLDASLWDRTDDTAERALYLQIVHKHLGYQGKLVNYAVSSQAFAGALTQMLDTIIPAEKGHARSTFALMHQSGNDVTANRPYTSDQQAGYRANLDALANYLDSIGVKYGATGLTKRFYTTGATVTYNNPSSEANGSKPYNENCVYPWIQAKMPFFWDDANSKPKIDPYDWVEKSRWMITQSDGIHFRFNYDFIFMEWCLWRLKQLYDNSKADVAGKSFVFRIASGASTPGMMPTYRSGVNVIPKFRAYIEDTTGLPCPHFAVDVLGSSDSVSNGSGAAAIVADTRLAGASMQTVYAYGASAETAVLQNHIEVQHHGLPPGATGKLTVTGSRNATGANRVAEVLLGGASGTSAGTFNASSDATSNQLGPVDFTVPADGVLKVHIKPYQTNTFAYLTAWALDFD